MYPPQYLKSANPHNRQPPTYSATQSVESKSKQEIPISQRQISSNSNTHRSSRILEHMIDTDFKILENKLNDGQYRHQKVSEINSYRNYEEFAEDPLEHNEHDIEHNIEDEEKDEEEEEYIEMVVELDSENSLSLKVRPQDNPFTLAQQFCYSQNIDPKIITPFAKQIRQMQANNWPALYSISLPTSISDSKNYWGHSQASQKSTKTESYLNSSTTQANYEKENDKLFSNQTNSNTYTNTKSNSRVKYNAPKVYHSGKADACQSENESRVTQSNVFDRLYRGSLMKNKKQQEERVKEKVLQSHQQLRSYPNDNKESLNQSTTLFQNISSENQSIQNINNIAQLRIYNKNTKLQEESRLRSSYLKEEYEIMKQEECTNHPQINPLSRLIVQKLRQDQTDIEGTYQDGEEDQSQYATEGSRMKKSNFVRLYEQKEKSKEKNISRIIEYMKDKEEKEMKECTFHPKILKKSQCQVLNTQRHLLLHEDFYIRENKSKTAKANEAKKIFERHHPEINEVSTELVKGRTFNERMIEYKAVADQNKEKLKKERLSLENHRPAINKNSKNNKKRNTSIGEHLYSKSLEKKEIKQQNHKLVVDKKSDLLYERMKINAFHQLFMDFDSDEDGLISPLKINININPEVLHILAPLLSEMEEVQIELDEEEFINSMNRLFQTMNIQQRNVIVNVTKNPRRRWQTNEQPSFNPSLNEKSIEMVKETREPGISLYEMGIEKEIEKEYKLNELRALKAMIEFEECTFHPNLIVHH